MFKCKKCKGKGWIDEGNNDYPCDCSKGDTTVMSDGTTELENKKRHLGYYPKTAKRIYSGTEAKDNIALSEEVIKRIDFDSIGAVEK
jgi:hypothetical protein